MRWGLPGPSKVAAQTWRWSDISSQRLSTLGEPVQVDKTCRISLSSKSLLKTHNYRFAFMRRPLNIILLLFLARRISFSFSPTALHFHYFVPFTRDTGCFKMLKWKDALCTLWFQTLNFIVHFFFMFSLSFDMCMCLVFHVVSPSFTWRSSCLLCRWESHILFIFLYCNQSN